MLNLTSRDFGEIKRAIESMKQLHLRDWVFYKFKSLPVLATKEPPSYVEYDLIRVSRVSYNTYKITGFEHEITYEEID